MHTTPLFFRTLITLIIRFKLLLSLVIIANISFADRTTEVTPLWDGFGGAIHLGNGHLLLPNNVEPWAGFGGMNSGTSDGFPYSFPSGGQVRLTAYHPTGGTVKIQLQFEYEPHPNRDPLFKTEEIEISGGIATEYPVDITSKGNNTYSNLIVYIINDGNDSVDDEVIISSIFVTEYGLDPVVPVEPELPPDYANYYTPSNVASFGSGNFTFGQSSRTGEAISWKQEIDVQIHNEEIQQYKGGYVGTDSNDNLVLRIKRIGSNTYHSSRVNSSIYNGIKVGPGEKLSVEFEAQLPMARDSDGNYVENVPLWPALWLMGNDQLGGSWVGWPFCAEIDVMEWSPTKPAVWPASGLETQANVAYHWHGADSGSGYTHWQNANFYTENNIHTQFHKWRVDIYRYNDGTTNKIEMFLNDVYIPNSRRYEDPNALNQEYWAPTTSKNPTQTFGSGDKEYFLIMNIAMGGVYPETSFVPSNFDYAEMVVKSVTYEVSSLNAFTLDLNYDSTQVSVAKTPDLEEYPKSSSVTVQATPSLGYLLADPSWALKEIIMESDTDEAILTVADLGDDDGDGLTNFSEAIVYNSDLNSADSDNDQSNDYFESIAGTSLTDANDYFYLQGSMNTDGFYNLEYNAKANRNYSINVSDDLINWYNWKTATATEDDITHSNIFNPSVENINGLEANSTHFFFKVDIEKQN